MTRFHCGQFGAVVELHTLGRQPVGDDARLGFIQHVGPVAVAAEQVMHAATMLAQPLDDLQRGDAAADYHGRARFAGQRQNPFRIVKMIQLDHLRQVDSWNIGPNCGRTGRQQQAVVGNDSAIRQDQAVLGGFQANRLSINAMQTQVLEFGLSPGEEVGAGDFVSKVVGQPGTR